MAIRSRPPNPPSERGEDRKAGATAGGAGDASAGSAQTVAVARLVLPMLTPIGRRERGKCRLQVEFDGRKAYRTVNTRTDKHGRWCKPKKSTFRNGITVVVDDLEGERTTAWLAVDSRCVYVHFPNGEGFHVVDAPCMSPPRRTEEKSVMVMRPIFGLPGKEDRVEHVWPADPPELSDAWDA